MADQFDMFGGDRREKYETFRAGNPAVEQELLKLSRQLVRRGHKNYSINGLFEIIRWHRALETTGEYKLNNNYRAYYARDLMEEYPELDGFFRVRSQKEAG